MPRAGGGWRSRGLLAGQAAWSAWTVAIALLVVASLRLSPGGRRRLAPLVVALFAADLVAAHAATNPGLSFACLYPRTPAVRFLAEKPGRVAGIGGALHPNAAMVYGLYDARGDDSIKLARYEELYAAHLGAGHPTYFQPIDRWQDPWLDRLGVRWVLTGPREAPPVAGWRLAYEGADARVFERPTALPLVRWAAEADRTAASAVSASAFAASASATAASASVSPVAASASAAAASASAVAAPTRAAPGTLSPLPSVIRRSPGAWEISYRIATPATLEVAEVWDRGWRAWVDGVPRPVETAEGPLLGVRLAPGAGILRLAYFPAGMGWGALVSLLGISAAALLRVRGGRPAQHMGEGGRAEQEHGER